MAELKKGIDENVMAPGPAPGTVNVFGSNEFPGFNPRQELADGLIIDRDVAFQLRDGATCHADIYRPQGAEQPLPSILVWSAYGKHLRWSRMVGSGVDSEVDPAALSPHTVFESPDPVPLCAQGYAYVAVDPRGVYMSEGNSSVLTPQEGEDMYDTIEWIAAQPWCTGKVGMAGASYYGWSQWRAGASRPPHLAALLIYDGVSDPYRDFAFHGGIFNNVFVAGLTGGVSVTLNRRENLTKACELHPFLDDYWRAKAPPVEQIDVPLFVVSSWADHAIHTRGTLEGYKRAGTKRKWLEAHGRKKWMWMYRPESVQRQIAFFDRFLKGVEQNEVDSWPPVRIEVREQANKGVFRDEQEWPLARTEFRRLYLDAATRSLVAEPLQETSSLSYEANDKADEAVFEHTFDKGTEITGHAKLRLWVSAEGSDDMDLFVALQKVDVEGKIVNFPYFSFLDDGQVSLGFLRVSHRELDPSRSTPEQPVLLHQREQRLAPGEIVPVEIEFLPQSTRFAAGEKLRVLVKGTDIQDYAQPSLAAGHHFLRNAGRHVLHTGKDFDSHLLLPAIPIRP